MAKKAAAGTNKTFKCRVCGQDFGKERAERANHEKDKHPGVEAGKQKTKKPVASQGQSSNDMLKAAADKIAAEIVEKRDILANLDKLKADITALEKRHQSILALLPKEA